MKLLDVNVWLSGVWQGHRRHQVSKAWMEAAEDEIAFCRVTQMAFLRLTTNPAVTGLDALTRREAWNLLDRITIDRRVRFLVEPEGLLPLWVAFSKRDDSSHLLWTGDYLAAFAAAADAELVTLDRRLTGRYPSVKVICLL